MYFRIMFHCHRGNVGVCHQIGTSTRTGNVLSKKAQMTSTGIQWNYMALS